MNGTRTLEWIGAASFFGFAMAQCYQAFLLTGLPAPNDFAATVAFDLSAPNQARLVLLFACFFAMTAGYVAACRRLGASGWALAGLAWIGLFLVFELLNRGFEIANVLAWERAWLASPDEAMRGKLAERINLFGELQATASLLILPCYALGSAAFALAIGGRDRWSRFARLGVALNAARATLRFGALVLGISFLGPVSDAIFFPVMIFQYVALGVWLALPEREPAR
jgi:hypothetical protein